MKKEVKTGLRHCSDMQVIGGSLIILGCIIALGGFSGWTGATVQIWGKIHVETSDGAPLQGVSGIMESIEVYGQNMPFNAPINPSDKQGDMGFSISLLCKATIRLTKSGYTPETVVMNLREGLNTESVVMHLQEASTDPELPSDTEAPVLYTVTEVNAPTPPTLRLLMGGIPATIGVELLMVDYGRRRK